MLGVGKRNSSSRLRSADLTKEITYVSSFEKKCEGSNNASGIKKNNMYHMVIFCPEQRHPEQ